MDFGLVQCIKNHSLSSNSVLESNMSIKFMGKVKDED